MSASGTPPPLSPLQTALVTNQSSIREGKVAAAAAATTTMELRSTMKDCVGGGDVRMLCGWLGGRVSIMNARHCLSLSKNWQSSLCPQPSLASPSRQHRLLHLVKVQTCPPRSSQRLYLDACRQHAMRLLFEYHTCTLVPYIDNMTVVNSSQASKEHTSQIYSRPLQMEGPVHQRKMLSLGALDLQ